MMIAILTQTGVGQMDGAKLQHALGAKSKTSAQVRLSQFRAKIARIQAGALVKALPDKCEETPAAPKSKSATASAKKRKLDGDGTDLLIKYEDKNDSLLETLIRKLLDGDSKDLGFKMEVKAGDGGLGISGPGSVDSGVVGKE